jgi:hypothetical protein
MNDAAVRRVTDKSNRFVGERIVSRWLYNAIEAVGDWDSEYEPCIGFRWAGLLRDPGRFLDADLGDFQDRDDRPSANESKFLAWQTGVIFVEDDKGFIRARYYITMGSLSGDWDRLQNGEITNVGS